MRRAEDYATLGTRVVVKLHTESHATQLSTRAWAITRRAQRAHRRQADRDQRGERHAPAGSSALSSSSEVLSVTRAR